jgi:hypothetical protein
MARSIWHRSLMSMLALCGVLLVVSLQVHGGFSPPRASAATTSAPTTVPECGNADVTATYRARDAATGHRFGVIRLTNTGDRACVVQGYGGLSYVGGGNGTQVGAAADRDPGKAPRVVLQPGDRVRSMISETVAQNYPRATCRPTKVDGFRVYVPDSMKSQFVKHATTGCRNDAVHLISHKPFRS